MIPKLVVLNGPPGSGKTTLGHIAAHSLSKKLFITMPFADILKVTCHTLLGLPRIADYYESVKDKIRPEFLYMTPRQFYIKTAESLKSTFGKDFFGVLWLKNYERTYNLPIPIITDCGFREELIPILNHFPNTADVLFIRLHRPGTSYDGDSRSYVYDVFPRECDLHNLTDSTEVLLNKFINCWIDMGYERSYFDK